MFGWLSKLFGAKTAEIPPSEPSPARQPAPLAEQKAESAAKEEFDWNPKPIDEDDAAFLKGLLSGGTNADLQTFAPHDRAFLSLVMRKTHSGDLSIPLLPEAAVKIRKLMGNADVPISKFVEVFRNDPALTAEVLKVANSSFYGFESPTHDLTQAVLRVGVNQVQTLVMMMSVRSKVLHGGQYGAENNLITTLALATARASGELAGELGVGEDEAFTRGLLSHLEFFVLLGVAAEFNASHKGYAVSRSALAEAVKRLGPDMFGLVAKKWGLENLGYGAGGSEGEGQSEVGAMRTRISAVSLATVEAWSGLATLTGVEGIDPVRLAEAIGRALGKKTPPPQGG